MPQRADTEGPRANTGQQEADTETRRASAELQLCQRGFHVIGFMNTYFRMLSFIFLCQVRQLGTELYSRKDCMII